MPAIQLFCGLLILTTAVAGRSAEAATVASPNFLVTASSESIARQVAAAAEFQRRKLARLWYGHELANWSRPCTIDVDASPEKGAGGSTSFKFSGGEVYGWRMRVQGSVERILDSVIPHEINHTILACYFRRKVPRWADEGAATIFEHVSERQRQIEEIRRLMKDGRRIPLRILMGMSQYPSDMAQVMAMYAQSYSVTDYLIQTGGRQTFLQFLTDAHQLGWDRALQRHYRHQSIEELEQDWTGWVMAGFPRLDLPEGQLLVDADAPSRTVIRAQSPPDSGAEESTSSRWTALPAAGLRPAVRIATQLRASWRATAAVLSPSPRAGLVSTRTSLTERKDIPTAGTAEPPAGPASTDAERLQELKLIPLDQSAAARRSEIPTTTDASQDRPVFEEPNPFAQRDYDGLSRLSQSRDSRRTSLEGRFQETRLHQNPQPEEHPRPAADWGRFPERIR